VRNPEPNDARFYLVPQAENPTLYDSLMHGMFSRGFEVPRIVQED